jgi:hypothetical protein
MRDIGLKLLNAWRVHKGDCARTEYCQDVVRQRPEDVGEVRVHANVAGERATGLGLCGRRARVARIVFEPRRRILMARSRAGRRQPPSECRPTTT